MQKKLIKYIAGSFLGKRIFQKLFVFLRWLSLKGMNFGGGVFPKESGEARVVSDFLERSSKPLLTVFDVGANSGSYTNVWLESLSQTRKSAHIFAFEPARKLYEDLIQKFSKNATVQIFPWALSDRAGQAVLHSDFEGSGMASLAKRNMEFLGIGFEREEVITTQTLDEFCLVNGIGFIDFLKMDVEGFEFAVLKGGEKMLSQGRIGAIQFEFGGANIDTKVFFKDFFYLLSERYNLYRILKDGLWPISRYSELEEVFITTNYYAEIKNDFKS